MGRIFGSHERSRRLRSVFTALFAVTAMTLAVGIQAALASHPEVSLAGSNFEIDTDANLKLDDAAPSIDWASVTEIRKTDTQSGNNDESFGQGTKENTAVPTVVDGSIPPNKSDLKAFGVYQEGSGANGFLNLFWSRVQDPSGTTNMDFEFNKNQCPGAGCSANGVTPIRSTGDILVIYDLSQGGTHPTLSIRRWTAGGVWGPATQLADAVDAAGSINTSPILAADSDGLGAQDPRTFGEAQLDLSVIFQGSTGCTSFGSAYLKSRSSDSFTAALKDFVPPVGISISNCGSVEITKTDDASPANPLAGAVFNAYKDDAPTGGTGPGAEDLDVSSGNCTTAVTTGKCTITGLLTGNYWIVETTTPTGYDTAAPKLVTVAVGTTTTVSFVDPAQTGAITITKTAKHADTTGGTSANLAAGFTHHRLEERDAHRVDERHDRPRLRGGSPARQRHGLGDNRPVGLQGTCRRDGHRGQRHLRRRWWGSGRELREQAVDGYHRLGELSGGWRDRVEDLVHGPHRDASRRYPVRLR